MEYYKNLDLADIHYINDEGINCVEQWEDVLGEVGRYTVSNLGRVKSLERYDKVNISTHSCRHNKSKILKQKITSRGYCSVTLTCSSVRKYLLVHRVVMFAFEGSSKLVVDHKNELKTDNRFSNLRYCTHRQNITYSVQNKNTLSQYVGVTFDKKTNKWPACIWIDNERYHLGYFDSEFQASRTYQKALKKWNELEILPERVKPKSSKYKNISFNSKASKWCAIYKKKWLGHYNDEEVAYQALIAYIESLPPTS